MPFQKQKRYCWIFVSFCTASNYETHSIFTFCKGIPVIMSLHSWMALFPPGKLNYRRAQLPQGKKYCSRRKLGKVKNPLTLWGGLSILLWKRTWTYNDFQSIKAIKKEKEKENYWKLKIIQLPLKILSIFFWGHYKGKWYSRKTFKDTEGQISAQLPLKVFYCL